MLGFVQPRAGFAENTVLRVVPAQNAYRARAKPCYASALHAWVRAGPRGFSAIVGLRFSRENCAWFLSSMLGSAQVRAGFADKNPAPRCVVVLYRDSTRSALWKFAEFAIS